MDIKAYLKRNLRITDDFGPQFTALIVMFHGIFIISDSLLAQLSDRRLTRLTGLSIDISLAIGLSLIYLSVLLRRRKRTAWFATALAYTFYLGVNLEGLTDLIGSHHLSLIAIFRALILPAAILLTLILNHKKYIVQSDRQGFQAAIKFSLIILAVAFIYGVAGFSLLGKDNFHQSLSLPAAMHYTIDQIGLTTNHPIHAYTKRGRLFNDSLSFVSIAALVYVAISFFQPLKFKFSNQRGARERFRQLLLIQHNANSEDYFKLWPPDKQYFFDSTGKSGLAYHVVGSVAVVLGGPAGKQARFKQLLSEFQYVCYGNDWRPTIVHTEDTNREIYEELGYTMQKIGQEGVVDLEKFTTVGVKGKYFRNIVNKFAKQNYSYELLQPPHHDAVIQRLGSISNDWLSHGNRTERGFTMGYFTEEYVNQCEVMVARDAANTIQAFLNLVPADFDTEEATYDMLRYSNESPGNINDFLLISLSKELFNKRYKRLNLGICPLAGMEDDDEKTSNLINNVLSFAYDNADRFYSFSGLYRFKNKYSPVWRDRYVAYQGGLSGFSKATNALVRVMKNTAKHTPKN
jgi:phosphatidylglycerol lysyltransferase